MPGISDKTGMPLLASLLSARMRPPRGDGLAVVDNDRADEMAVVDGRRVDRRTGGRRDVADLLVDVERNHAVRVDAWRHLQNSAGVAVLDAVHVDAGIAPADCAGIPCVGWA